MRVLLVDCDANRSALDWIEGSGGALGVDSADGRDLTMLARLRQVPGYDVVVVDLPGAREGALQTMLRGAGDLPVADALIVPCEPEALSLRPVVRSILGEVRPLGLPHLVVLTRVAPQGLARAAFYQGQLAKMGIRVARRPIRAYAVYREAVEGAGTVLALRAGRRSMATQAAEDYQALAAEAFSLATLGRWISDRKT
jgi:chromosome partitioning protein